MNLQAPPDAPLILHLGAGLLLFTHIAGGATAIVAGGVAMAARKGSKLHRRTGNAFFAGMMGMTVVGMAVSPLLPTEQVTNTTAAVFAFYMTITGWLAVRRPPGTVSAVERGIVLLPLGIVAEALVLAAQGFPTGPGGDYVGAYAFGALSALALACDALMLRAGGLHGASRLTRHVWRISFALFVAVGSFFLGQQKFLPVGVRGTIVPALPVLAVIATGLFWLIRTRFAGRFRPRRAAAA